MAIAALVLGIIAIVLSLFGTVSWYVGIPALIFAIVTIVRDNENKTEKDVKLAKISIGLSAAAMVIGLIMTIVWNVMAYNAF